MAKLKDGQALANMEIDQLLGILQIYEEWLEGFGEERELNWRQVEAQIALLERIKELILNIQEDVDAMQEKIKKLQGGKRSGGGKSPNHEQVGVMIRALGADHEDRGLVKAR